MQVVRDEERNQHEREVRQERWHGQSGPAMRTRCMHRHPLRQDAKHQAKLWALQRGSTKARRRPK